MKQTIKIILAAGIGLVAGYAFARAICKEGESEEKSLNKAGNTKNQKEEETISEPKQAQKTKPEKEKIPDLDDSFPLRLGSKGRRVERLQLFLMRKLGGSGIPTRVFDAETAGKVRQWFQKDTIDEATYEQLQLDKMLHDQRGRKGA
mgnify:CR=1 FL=1